MTDRKAAYDAVYAYIDKISGELPPDEAHRNAMIWTAVQAALEADTNSLAMNLQHAERENRRLHEELARLKP